MSPPTRGEVLTLLDEGREKHGWKWMRDEHGYWWGARQGTEAILQVRPESPDFPARRWTSNGDALYTPTPRWAPLKSVF